MYFQMLDFLDKIVAQDFEGDSTPLTKDGVLTSNGQMVLNKINLMTGTYASNLADGILEADMDLQDMERIKAGLEAARTRNGKLADRGR